MTAFKPVKVFLFGRVYGRPEKIDKEMRNVPMCMYCKNFLLLNFKNLLIYLKIYCLKYGCVHRFSRLQTVQASK